ncbi:MAG: hypothetical protein LBR75_02105 [Prevotellaceae bacterium]|jgi:hypothetical protein|nr:hypothetical protein [Prevotellaceae bacterium]
MRIVSKFRLQYILGQISEYGFFLVLMNMLFLFLSVFGNTFGIVFWILLAVVNIAVFVFYYYHGWKFEKIIVTEDQIFITDLFTKKTRQINYDEIIRLQYDYQTVHSGSITKYKHRYLILNNKTIFVFNSYVYKNFKELENCILSNRTKGEDNRLKTIFV